MTRRALLSILLVATLIGLLAIVAGPGLRTPDEQRRWAAFRECVLQAQRAFSIYSVAYDEAIRTCNEEFYR